MQAWLRQNQAKLCWNLRQRHVCPPYLSSSLLPLVHGPWTDGSRHLYLDEAVAYKPGYLHPIAQEPLPIVFGHEFGGVVTEVGDGVTRASVGDLVAVHPSFHDGTCPACIQGSPNVCQGWGFLGIHASGGMAESAVVEQRAVFRMPKGIKPEVAALVEPLAVGWHSTRLATGLDRDSTVLILGGGPVGCAVYLALAAQGLKNIVISEITEARRDILGQLGAELVFSPINTDIVQKVKDLSGGWGAQAVFECAGVQVTLDTALAALQPRGTVVNLAIRAASVSLSLNEYVFKEATLVSSLGHTEADWVEVISAIGNGSMKPEVMVTRKIAMPDLVEKGIKMLAQPGQTDCKILVDVQG